MQGRMKSVLEIFFTAQTALLDDYTHCTAQIYSKSPVSRLAWNWLLHEEWIQILLVFPQCFSLQPLWRMNEDGRRMDGPDLVNPSQIHQAYYSRGSGVTVITYKLIKHLIYFFGHFSEGSASLHPTYWCPLKFRTCLTCSGCSETPIK